MMNNQSNHRFISRLFHLVFSAFILAILPIMQASALDIINESTRGPVGSGSNNLMILGFITEGNDTQQFLLFGGGPTLEEFGVTGVLQDPKMTLFNNSTGAIIDSNDNWKEHPSSALTNEALKEVGLTLDDNEAAMTLNLPEGSYTLEIEGVGGTTGIALGGVEKTNASAPKPPPDTNPGNVCSRELCATNEAAAQQCQDFLESCLLVEDEDECVGGALLICGTV